MSAPRSVTRRPRSRSSSARSSDRAVTGPGLDGLPTRARKDVDKYLLKGEDPVVVTRRHWAVLIEPTVKFVPAVVIGGWLLLLDPENRVTSSAGLLVLLAAFVYYGLRLAEWWMRHF